nr:BFH_HP1_G0048730.mRNA.1.CDS.1 [Saccharomyces cerevisiae]
MSDETLNMPRPFSKGLAMMDRRISGGPDLGRGGLQNYDDIVLNQTLLARLSLQRAFNLPARVNTCLAVSAKNAKLKCTQIPVLTISTSGCMPPSYIADIWKWPLRKLIKCGPTKTAFSVGAVLVHGTQVLATGYPRELPGNTHAEQCALIKYLQLHLNCPTYSPYGNSALYNHGTLFLQAKW